MSYTVNPSCQNVPGFLFETLPNKFVHRIEIVFICIKDILFFVQSLNHKLHCLVLLPLIYFEIEKSRQFFTGSFLNFFADLLDQLDAYLIFKYIRQKCYDKKLFIPNIFLTTLKKNKRQRVKENYFSQILLNKNGKIKQYVI